MIHEIQQAFEKFGMHILERQSLREIFSDSETVCVRIFGSQGQSETTSIPKDLLGFDGFYGGYIEAGGRIDVIGLDKNKAIINSIRLNRNQSRES